MILPSSYRSAKKRVHSAKNCRCSLGDSPPKEFPVRAHDEGTHQNGILAYFGRQIKGFDLIVDELRVAALPFDNVVVSARAPAIDLRIARLVGFVALVLLFDGRNVRLVIDKQSQ